MQKRNLYKVTAFVETNLEICELFDKLLCAKEIPGSWTIAQWEAVPDEGNSEVRGPFLECGDGVPSNG